MAKRNQADNKLAVEALKLSRQIKPLLYGRDPGVVGAALADLVSLLIAGHHPSLRDEILLTHIDTVRTLIAANAKEIEKRFGGMPPQWREH
jgi:hypothetical protein